MGLANGKPALAEPEEKLNESNARHGKWLWGDVRLRGMIAQENEDHEYLEPCQWMRRWEDIAQTRWKIGARCSFFGDTV